VEEAMKIKEDIKPISYVKTHTTEVLMQVNETQRPLYVTQNGTAKAVIVDAETYESMKKTIAMLKLIAMAEKDIEAGNLINQDEVFEKIEKENPWLKK
jgi:prevent-host-death family protein